VTLLQTQKASLLRGARALVSDVDLRIAAGELVVIVGPNGAGKTSLLKLLTGEIPASSGRVSFDGIEIGQWPAWRLASRRCVMAQAQALAFPFSVVDVVRVGVDGIGRPLDARTTEALLVAALTRADVAHLAARDYQTLSGGEQQRVQFARVLAQLAAGARVAGEQVLFLDEPIASLDLCHQFSVMDTAAELAREGVAVVAVLHDLNLAATYADRLAVMRAGRIVADGPPIDIVDESLLREVFEVSIRVQYTPENAIPCVLPQARRLGDARISHLCTPHEAPAPAKMEWNSAKS
jgi:iron complex transport system ATP-binding protein